MALPRVFFARRPEADAFPSVSEDVMDDPKEVVDHKGMAIHNVVSWRKERVVSDVVDGAEP